MIRSDVLWSRLTPEARKDLREKYKELTEDRDPYSPYDFWGDVELLEELYGHDNLKSENEESIKFLMAPREKVMNIWEWAKECAPDNEEAQIILNLFEILFNEK